MLRSFRLGPGLYPEINFLLPASIHSATQTHFIAGLLAANLSLTAQFKILEKYWSINKSYVYLYNNSYVIWTQN